MNSIVIFDIDGTLANCDQDTAIPQVLELARLFHALKDIVFFTGRSEEHRLETVTWLSKHLGLDPALINLRLFMRVAGDRREDSVIKSQMLDEVLKVFPLEAIWGVFDDRHSVCQMWVDRGIFVFDVAQGKGHF